MPEISDKELIQKTKKGDDEAYAVLVGRYIKPLYNFVVRLSGSTSEAEDVVQDSFVKAWKKLWRFDTRQSFKPWLYTIARNTFLDSVKNKKEIPMSSFDTEEGNFIEDTTVDEVPSIEDNFDQKLRSQNLDALVSKLQPLYQVVVILHIEENLTFQEMSEILKESIDTIKSRYRRACTKLRDLIV